MNRTVSVTVPHLGLFLGAGICAGVICAGFAVVSLVNWETRYALWRAERSHQQAIQEIKRTRDTWAVTLSELGAKRDTVDRWRRYVPKGAGGKR